MFLHEYQGYTKQSLLRELTIAEIPLFVSAIYKRKRQEYAILAQLGQASVAAAMSKKALDEFKRMIRRLTADIKVPARNVTPADLQEMRIMQKKEEE